MRRNWDNISVLLDVIERLAGHPNLKDLRDDANADLSDLISKSTKKQHSVGVSSAGGAGGFIEPTRPEEEKIVRRPV